MRRCPVMWSLSLVRSNIDLRVAKSVGVHILGWSEACCSGCKSQCYIQSKL